MYKVQEQRRRREPILLSEIRVVASFTAASGRSFHLGGALTGLWVTEQETFVPKEGEKSILLDLRGKSGDTKKQGDIGDSMSLNIITFFYFHLS